VYVPAHFAARPDQLHDLLGTGGLVDLVSLGADGLICTPLPMLYVPATDGPGVLQGHLARNNPHWSSLVAGSESLAIGHGVQDYVSPAWYASKAEHGRVVPTWNYVTVHVYGRLVVHDDVDWLRQLVTRLTEHHEQRTGTGWQVSDAPPAFIDGQLKAIVGIELVISRVEAKAKLSQNRSAADRAGVVAGLGPGSPVSRAMTDS